MRGGEGWARLSPLSLLPSQRGQRGWGAEGVRSGAGEVTAAGPAGGGARRARLEAAPTPASADLCTRGTSCLGRELLLHAGRPTGGGADCD